MPGVPPRNCVVVPASFTRSVEPTPGPPSKRPVEVILQRSKSALKVMAAVNAIVRVR